MRANRLIIQTVRQLYLKYGGRRHRLIEREMRALGCVTFSRRCLYDKRTPYGIRKGWIDRYGWKEELAARSEDTPVLTDAASRSEDTPDRSEDTPVLTDAASASGQTSPAILPDSSDQGAENRSLEEKSVPAPGLAPSDFTSWLKRISPNMKWDWRYQQLIYDKLRQVTDGTTKRLMIFMPPRHGKSELVTVRYTAWRLQQDPSLNVILGSYNQRLANRFSRKVRITFEDAMQLDNGQLTIDSGRQRSGSETSGVATAGPEKPIVNSQLSTINSTSSRRRLNTVAEWETGLGGGVRAVGVGAGITGYGAKLVIIDDPVRSRAEAESKTYRERVWEWFNDDLYTRLEPDAAMILIQTRWHEDDLAGRLLKEADDGGEQWEVISLPALAEERSEDTPVLMSAKHEDNTLAASGDEDKRFPTPTDILDRPPGEPLCPERFNEQDLLRIKRQLGSYSFSALYQQRPTPPEGGLFKRRWFTRIVDRPPEGLRWVRSYDLAVSTKDNADYTASFRCALDKRTGDLYIADGIRKRMEFPEQRRYFIEKLRTERNTEHGIELALHGQAFIQQLRREMRFIRAAIRGVRVTEDKFTRALSWANRAEEGKIVLVRGPWIDAFLEEVTSFPNSAHNDQIDAVSLAVHMLDRHRSRAFGF